MKKKLIQNSTQMPNILLDFIYPRVPEAECKCLMYICRRTFGFHKEEDRISFTQFIGGVKTKDGKVLDLGTGLSRASVATALKGLARAKAIFVKKSLLGNYYKINLSMDKNKVVQIIDQSRKHTEISSNNRPKQVQLLNLQKKEKQRETKYSVFRGKNAIQELVNYYFELRDWNDEPKEFYKKNNISYPRHCKTAKQILTLCDGDLKTAKAKVAKIQKWADTNCMEWSLETTIKRFF